MADDLVQARTQFHTTVEGVPFMVMPGDVFRASDPVAKKNAKSFAPVEVRDSRQIVSRAVARAAGKAAPATPSSVKKPDPKPAAAKPPAKPAPGASAAEVEPSEV